MEHTPYCPVQSLGTISSVSEVDLLWHNGTGARTCAPCPSMFVLLHFYYSCFMHSMDATRALYVESETFMGIIGDTKGHEIIVRRRLFIVLMSEASAGIGFGFRGYHI